MARPPDPGGLVAGLGVLAIGVLVLLDGTGTLRLRFGLLGPLVCLVVGGALLAAGLSRRG
jgi:hypothetical protein